MGLQRGRHPYGVGIGAKNDCRCLTQARKSQEIPEDEFPMAWLCRSCFGEGSECFSSSVQVSAACCPSPCEMECGCQTLAVGLSDQGGPDLLPRVAWHTFDLFGLGFGGLSSKVGIKVGLPRRGDVSPSATPVMQHGRPCTVRGQEWQNPSFISPYLPGF